MVRRCKYFFIQCVYEQIATGQMELCCLYGCRALSRSIIDRCRGCEDYQAAELNPDWKEFVDELNRRLK